MKKNLITVFALLLTTTLLLSVTNTTAQVEAAGEVVSIPDANLAAALREALGLPPGAAITSDALRNLTRLEAEGRGIADLTGLEYAVNLTWLDLGATTIDGEWRENPISNVSPLASLTNLEWLDLASTGVSDVSALAHLTNLEWLDLGGHFVSDVSALAGLTNLEWLDLGGPFVSDVSSLASLTNLRTLDLGGTLVSDVSSLARLTNLEELSLHSTTDVSDVSALANLTNLEWLGLGWTGVSDVSALARLTNLEGLYLQHTGVSDVSALASLTNLKRLYLDWTDVSDVSALANLTNLEELNLKNCPLNAAAHQTHIPAIQANGTEVAFDPFKPIHLPGVPWLVSLIYFRPSDRPVRPNVDAEIDALIKESQRFFADEMERHGFGRKTFQFEADANGNAVVHHVNGKFPYAHYQQNLSWDKEINEQVYILGNRITTIMIDTGGEEKLPAGVCGHGRGSPYNGGGADIYCWEWSTIAHELGHAFGMGYHDFRSDNYLMSYGYQNKLSPCFAAWLDVHPAFNPTVVRIGRATIQMFSATLAAPPNAIRLRFTVTAPAGSLYQARLLTPEKRTLDGYAFSSGGLIGCKRIDGNPTSKTVEFVTALTPDTESVSLQIISIDGNSVDRSFPIDVASLLPPAKVVSIPDPNLVAAVREALNMSSGEIFTTHSILNLVKLDARNRGIKDLTGLEHAVNLKEVDLGAEYINGRYVNSNAISDLSPLSDLTNLEVLSLGKHITLNHDFLRELPPLAAVSIPDPNLAAAIREEILLTSNEPVTTHSILSLVGLDARNRGIKSLTGLEHAVNLKEVDLAWEYISGEGYVNSNAISDFSPLEKLTALDELSLGGMSGLQDVSALARLTNLEELDLASTGVSDVSALARFTHLERLYLTDTAVSDVSALATLTKLATLYLHGTAISDVSSLAGLTNLKLLYLRYTGVSDVSSLARLTNLEWLHLGNTAVSDVSPLLGLSLPGVSWDSIGLDLAGCPLSYASIHTHIPALQAKGIEVLFDNVAHPALLKVSGDKQEGAGATALPNPFVVEAMDEHGEPMVGRTVQFDILGGGGRLSAKTVETDARGKARVTFTLGRAEGVNKVKASSEGIQSWVLFTAVGTGAAPQLVADVNGDGVTDLADLAIVAQAMGKPVENPRADVNGDGVVDGEDFALVAAALGEGEAAAPSQVALPAGLTLEKVEWALNLLHAENTGSPAFRRGIAKLEGILALLVPDETVLLANYPNPFNPETWIPYQLSEPAEVTVTIYAANGAVVRMLDLGHRRAGSYDSRGRAAYWDGRNAQGEPVASGVYFYTLSAGDFKATRKMVIRK